MPPKKRTDNTPPTPEQIAEKHGLPLQRALIDFDITKNQKQVIGGDPIDLSQIPTEPVKSFITEESIVTISAHQGEGQAVADLLADNPFLHDQAVYYAKHYFDKNIMDFALNALDAQQLRNLQPKTNRDLSEFS